jgi:hypothetical protein
MTVAGQGPAVSNDFGDRRKVGRVELRVVSSCLMQPRHEPPVIVGQGKNNN